MKKLLHAVLLTAVPLFATAQVTVSTSQYTTEQLVNTVLFNTNSCNSVTNISSTTVAGLSPIGYFQKNTATFAFNDGVVLSTGNAAAAGGPINSESSGNWPGDDDLDAYMDQLGIPYTSADAAVLEFDFIAISNEISLEYLFASNEYGFFQCTFGDAVLFLLTNTTTGTVSNMAVIPGTVVPISTTTIRSNAYNSQCPSMNVNYFGSYYAENPTAAPVNFRGITVPLTAQASVNPGDTYHLKIVIADRQDPTFDSAIFLNAGSLDLGTYEDNPIEIISSNATVLCDGESATLSVDFDNTYSIEWQYNGLAIAGANGTSLDISQIGDYSVTVSHPSISCTISASITITGGSGVPADLVVPDYTLTDTNNDGYASFDLSVTPTTAIIDMLGSNTYSIAYYETLADAEFETNVLLTDYVNISNPQTIYVRIENGLNGCGIIKTFQLIVENLIIDAPTGNAEQTITEGATLADLEVDGENIQWYDNPGEGPAFPDGLDTPLPLTTPLQDGVTYYASQTINGVESTERFGVTVHITAGIEDYLLNALTYYPNPVKDVLTITNTNNIDAVSITNTLGQAVVTQTVNNTTAQIELSSLSKGIYFVEVASGSASKTIKVIKE